MTTNLKASERKGRRVGESLRDRATDAPHGAVLHRLRPLGSVSLSQEHIFGSPAFINRTRNARLAPPARFEPTVKGDGDVVI